MYDIYGHIHQTQLRLTVPKGEKLPDAAHKQRWKFLTHRSRIPKVIADEITRNSDSRSIARRLEQTPRG